MNNRDTMTTITPKTIVSAERIERFFNAPNCERCGNTLGVRTTSWFTIETICLECSRREAVGKKLLLAHRINPDRLEGCGYIPALVKEILCGKSKLVVAANQSDKTD